MAFVDRVRRIATICGAAPLLVGTVVFLGWLIVRWDWLMMAGAVVLYGGLAVFAVGVAALACFWWVSSRTPGVSPRRLRVATLGRAGLLLANFPVAAGIIWAAIAIETRYTVVVHNVSQEQLDRVRVFGGGCDASYGSLVSGATASRSFWIGQEGVLAVRASSGEDTLEHMIDPYVTPSGGGHLTVTVGPDQRITVTRQAAHQLALLDRIRDAMIWLDRSPCAGVERQSRESAGSFPPEGVHRWHGRAGIPS